MHLMHILEKSSRLYGSSPALTMRMGYRTVTLTYKSVQTLAQQVALFLADRGVQAGDTVVLCAPNSPYWICVWWGCILRGAYVVPLSPLSTASTLLKIITQTQPVLCFTSASVRQLPVTDQTFMVEQLPALVESYDVSAYKPFVDASDDEQIAEIMYTSGTTGDPKGVMLTHRNLTTNLEDICQVIPLNGRKERVLSILPLSHVLEQTIGFLFPFSVGAHIIYAHFHGAIRDLLKQYHITKIVAVPEFLKLMAARIQGQFSEGFKHTIFNILIKVATYLPSYRLRRLLFFPLHHKLGGSLNMIASGGAQLDEDIERFWNALGVCVLQGFGLTETSPGLTLNTFKNRRIGSVGKSLAHVTLRLGVDGEIEARGDNVTKGYYKNDAKTTASFTDDGWFKTGDMGYIDADGFLFIKGRKKYMIKGPGAENIFPEDIEEALNKVPGVRDSCVIGHALPSGMVEVHAVLLLQDQTIKPDDVVHEANQNLAPYQHVTGWSVWPLPDFPRSVTQKVKKEEVSAWVKAQSQQGQVATKGKTKNPLSIILSQISGVDVLAISSTTTLGHDLKFDSLMRVELVTYIEEMFGVLIDERLLTAKTTVDQVQQMIAQGSVVINVPRAKRWPRSWWAHVLRAFAYPLIWLVGKIFISSSVKGLEHLKNIKGPVIFMPNHTTLLDGLIVMMALPASFRRRLSFAAGYDVLYGEYKWVAWLVELYFNAFPFPRKEGDHITTGLLNLGVMLDNRYSVALFPEGQMSTTGELISLKKGAGLVAAEMGVPVIPMYIAGANKMMPFDCLIPRRRGHVTVMLGQPLTFKRGTPLEHALSTIDQALHQLAVKQ